MYSKTRGKPPVSKTHTHLMGSWDFDRNEIRPEDVSYGSGKGVWWLCSEGHSWSAVIFSRTNSKNIGCPVCGVEKRSVARVHNNLIKFGGLDMTHPHLLKEWDSVKNEGLSPERVACGSNKKVWWKCRKPECGCSWEAVISDRTIRLSPTKCPACAGLVATERNNLAVEYPELIKEWDFIKNMEAPNKVLSGSHKKVWWVCSKCGYSWKSEVRVRALRGGSCPVEAGRVATELNSLEALQPELSKEWDLHSNPLLPSEVTCHSNKKVHWICKECGHKWKATIAHRVNGTGCPVCSNRVVKKHNSFARLRPDLLKEWDDTRNKEDPYKISVGASKNIWWICEVCGRGWKTLLYNRTSHGKGCSFCNKGPISKISQRWLDSLNISDLRREYHIKDLKFRVDGFDPKTNTVYEFLGDYWHGNPKKYSADKINSNNKKSFGQLYQDTLKRFKLLKENGYKVKYVWEKDFKKL